MMLVFTGRLRSVKVDSVHGWVITTWETTTTKVSKEIVVNLGTVCSNPKVQIIRQFFAGGVWLICLNTSNVPHE